MQIKLIVGKATADKMTVKVVCKLKLSLSLRREHNYMAWRINLNMLSRSEARLRNFEHV